MAPTHLALARADRLIAAARLVIVLFTILAVWLDPDFAGGRTRLALASVAAVFALYAVALAVATGWRLMSRRARLIVHITDFLMYAILVQQTSGSVMFLMFW